jgi:glycolate oxidase iron-sulfur subunit
MVRLTPRRLPSPSPVDRPQIFAAAGERRARVALLAGCAQQALAPEINAATIRLLTRHGVEVVIPPDAGCCGALAHHLGRDADALDAARANIDAWRRELDIDGLDAVIINASGCGTVVKDYGFMLRTDDEYAEAADRISGLAEDITEFMARLGLTSVTPHAGLTVAYHSACSMQHGQKIQRQPRELLTQAGFALKEIPEGHLCCGSAGTYNILQPVLAGALRDRKVAHIERLAPDLVATGNIGCISQLRTGTDLPVVHTVELLDWASGGPRPPALARHLEHEHPL